MNKQELQATEAFANARAIMSSKKDIESSFLRLAYLLKLNRDLSYWKLLGHESFEEFLASPEISISRSLAYQLIYQYELYIEKLNRPEEELIEIGTAKLAVISPVVLKDPETWLEKARVLSKSDIKIEVAGALRKKIPPKTPLSKNLSPGALATCLLCGEGGEATPFPAYPSEYESWPENWVIYLCPACKREYKRNPSGWTWQHRKLWGKYLYDQALDRS